MTNECVFFITSRMHVSQLKGIKSGDKSLITVIFSCHGIGWAKLTANLTLLAEEICMPKKSLSPQLGFNAVT